MVEIAFIGRQPILDSERQTFGYELLFRDSEDNNACFIGNRYATSKVLTDTFNSFGIPKLIGDNKAFINIDHHFIHDQVIETVPKENFMLEILETVKVDELLIYRIKELKEMGYSFVLDDITLSDEQIENFKPIFEHISIVKIDMLQIKDFDIIPDRLKCFDGYNIEFLAEKVEDEEVFKKCKELGFKYFQGYFFARPQVLKNKKLDPACISVMNIIQKIENDAGTPVVVEQFKKNPELSINLFKYINSSSFFTKKDICSIPQAINLIGRKPLIRWLTLCMYSTSKNNNYFTVLMETALVRAEIMSMLAVKFNQEHKMVEKAYLVGLISLLDAIMNTPIEDIFNEISFHEKIKSAVLQKEGALGKLLKIVLIFEEGNIPKVRKLLKRIDLKEHELSQMLAKSYAAVNEQCQELKESI